MGKSKKINENLGVMSIIEGFPGVMSIIEGFPGEEDELMEKV